MTAAIPKHLKAVGASLKLTNRKPIALIDVAAFDPDNRDAILDGDESVLTGYWFEPALSHVSAIVISVHPDRRDAVDEIEDMDDEAFERMERRREMEDRRRQAAERERRHHEVNQAAHQHISPAPTIACDPRFDTD